MKLSFFFSILFGAVKTELGNQIGLEMLLGFFAAFAVLFLFACVRERLLEFFCLNLLAQRHFYFLSSEQNCLCFVFPEVASAAQKSESGGFLFVLKFCSISIISGQEMI